jgi:hypothetical protein
MWLLYKAANYSRALITITLLWLAFQLILSLSGFYTVINTKPPRFLLLPVPPIILVILLFFTKKGKQFIAGLNIKLLTLLHVVRIPVELILFWLYLYKMVPVEMTFEGRNLDIVSGITAPIVYYFGYIKNVLNKRIIIAWNIACLLLLINIVVTAMLSAPFPFQRFGLEQPNIALFYFPFVWLPCFIVPTVLLAHLTAIRKLLVKAQIVEKHEIA